MRTKIVATLGPKSESYETIRAFAAAGVSIFRLNFSHCTREAFGPYKTNIERASKELELELSVLQDLQGPRIRVGILPEEGIPLHEDDQMTFSTLKDDAPGTIFVDEPNLANDIKEGDPMLLSGGAMELVVEKIEGGHILARVIRGGTLFSRKGVNVPRTLLSVSGITKKDEDDLAFGLSQGVDYVAVSFVQSAADMEKVRGIVGKEVKTIAKIETRLAVDSIDAIIKASDGIMIARGDLGIEVPLEEVPFIQKNIIRHSAWLGKPTITATQMLLSMVNHSHPTRAEVTDIAQAVWDGTDAVMLSEETASGDHPIEAVETMVRVIRYAEGAKFDRPVQL